MIKNRKDFDEFKKLGIAEETKYGISANNGLIDPKKLLETVFDKYCADPELNNLISDFFDIDNDQSFCIKCQKIKYTKCCFSCGKRRCKDCFCFQCNFGIKVQCFQCKKKFTTVISDIMHYFCPDCDNIFCSGCCHTSREICRLCKKNCKECGKESCITCDKCDKRICNSKDFIKYKKKRYCNECIEGYLS